MSADKPEEGGMEKYAVVNTSKEKTARDKHATKFTDADKKAAQKVIDAGKKVTDNG